MSPLHAVKSHCPSPLRSLPWGCCSAPAAARLRIRHFEEYKLHWSSFAFGKQRRPRSKASLQRSVSVTEQAVDKVKVWPFEAHAHRRTRRVLAWHWGRGALGRDGNTIEAQALLSPRICEALLHLHFARRLPHSSSLVVTCWKKMASSGMGPCGSQELNSSQRQSSSCTGRVFKEETLPLASVLGKCPSQKTILVQPSEGTKEGLASWATRHSPCCPLKPFHLPCANTTPPRFCCCFTPIVCQHCFRLDTQPVQTCSRRTAHGKQCHDCGQLLRGRRHANEPPRTSTHSHTFTGRK